MYINIFTFQRSYFLFSVGASSLRRFRTVQAALQQTGGVPIGEGGADVAALIANEIYSDTHMLSLAYEGEMCYALYVFI